jgi:DNA-binding response OmpR family regulator
MPFIPGPREDAQPIVLIVEDDSAVRQALRRMLNLHGFSVRVAPTAAEAIDVARLETVTAVVLDLGLGAGMTGLHVLSWLRSQPVYSNLPVVIFTGNVDMPEHMEEQIRRHGAHVMFKPQPYEHLVEHLKRVTRKAD